MLESNPVREQALLIKKSSNNSWTNKSVVAVVSDYYRGQSVTILQAAVVREMKSQGASKEVIDVEVNKFLELKEKLGGSPAAAKGKKGKP